MRLLLLLLLVREMGRARGLLRRAGGRRTASFRPVRSMAWARIRMSLMRRICLRRRVGVEGVVGGEDEVGAGGASMSLLVVLESELPLRDGLGWVRTLGSIYLLGGDGDLA